ncbi:hypothetical protein BFW01_g8516 [Lasiodiplodia theobromae]|nr:hypothetical protein BFW01_g8516 [Lasiodiplodia theobromae]
MPPKHRSVGDDEEQPSNAVVPKRQLTWGELNYFVQAKGQHIGYVTRGQQHEGQPVFASIEDCSKVKLHLEGETRISADQVEWFESPDEELLMTKLKIFRKKAEGFRHAARKGLLCEFEFFEMREYLSALNVGYALMRHYSLIPRRTGVLPAERGLVSDTFDKDSERAEGFLDKLIAAFPEEKESLNPLSVARAAGYYTKFKDRFPYELQGPANDSRYDIYLLKASKKFWKEMTNQHADSNEEYSDEDRSEDKPARRPKKKRKTSAPEPELFPSLPHSEGQRA